MSSLPKFEINALEIEENYHRLATNCNKKIHSILSLSSAKEVSFENTFGVLADVFFELEVFHNRVEFLANVSIAKEIREKAREISLKMSEYYTNIICNPELYQRIKWVKKLDKKKYNQEDVKFFEDILQMFVRSGLELSPNGLKKFKSLDIKIQKLTQKIHVNISTSIKETLELTKEELEGVDSAAILKFQKSEKNSDAYIIHPGLLTDREVILKSAIREETRKKVYISNYKRCLNNLPLANRTIQIRSLMAKLLGFSSWADFKTDNKMAKNGKTAYGFIKRLSKRIEPNFHQELSTLEALKGSKMEPWDVLYYQTKVEKQKFELDHESLKQYFSLEDVLKNMFKVFEQVFQLSIEYIPLDYKWAPEVRCVVIKNNRKNEEQKIYGYLYLDLFPRVKEEKYSHFAFFTLVPGCTKNESTSIGALVCNFPLPNEHGESFLNYSHVETLFHEFGHGLHGILGITKYSSFSGTSVPRDFVEVPSQLLEYWIEDKTIIQKISPTFPLEALEKILQAKKEFISIFYRRQFAFCMMDFALHYLYERNSDIPINKLSNKMLKKYFLPLPKGCSMLASFGHLFGGYDAGYYGYAWADSIAADFAHQFATSKNGFLDQELGYKLREEIYEVGDSRPIRESIRKFLGRDTNEVAFLKLFKNNKIKAD